MKSGRVAKDTAVAQLPRAQALESGTPHLHS